MQYLNSKKTKIIMPVVCVISGCTSKHKVGKSGSKKTQKFKKKQITFHRLGYYTPIAKSLGKIRHFISATIECKHQQSSKLNAYRHTKCKNSKMYLNNKAVQTFT